MSEETETPEDAPEEASEDGGDDTGKKKRKKGSGKRRKKKKSKLKIIAIAAVGLFVLTIGGGGLAYSMGWIHAIMGWDVPNQSAELELGKPVVHPFPEIRTDLKTGQCRSPFLNALIHVQLSPNDVDQLVDMEAQALDAVLTHLREQERQHVVGKEGSERLRFELVQVINQQIAPAKIHTVFFKKLIVQ